MFPAYYVFPLSTSVFSGPQMNVLTGFYFIDPKEDISLGSLTAEFLKSSISNIAHIMDQFIEQDPDDERSSKARWDVLDVTSCYPEILHERKRTGRQLTMLDGFIIKKCKVEESKAGLSSQ
ncbi:hypothetical protein T12_6855 [Trichinella patagoniensis]|uniref:Uncharacterized protein n=1 Tax=Trichinella patagoniensis TaxID=990121 RepID=A0A0V0Z5D6_9BILA|nr:hypothetical protein T12_6855 [Trichinella patagoniensis]